MTDKTKKEKTSSEPELLSSTTSLEQLVSLTRMERVEQKAAYNTTRMIYFIAMHTRRTIYTNF